MYTAKRMENIPFSAIRTVFEKVTVLEKAGEDVIHLEIGRPDFNSPGHVIGGAVDALQAGKVHYTSNYGIAELTRAIADKFQADNGLSYDSKGEILVTAGANEAVFIAMLALINPGDEVLIPCPCWPTYFSCVHMAGGVPVAVATDAKRGFAPDIDALSAAVTSKTKMLILNSPNNPTGAVYDKNHLLTIAKLAQKHDLLVLSDEVYEKILYDDNEHISIASLPGMKERTLTINGFSKVFSMTGWRLAYVGACRPLMDALVRIHQNTIACATSFAQWGGLEALTGSMDAVHTMLAEFDRRRQLVHERITAMPGVRLEKPKGAFYAFIDISGLGMDSFALADILLDKARIAVVPGATFGAFGENCIRISYACEYSRLQEALDRFGTAVATL